ncbi:MAG: YraN family protein, partial [Planctomycetaceae bacterium]|nr:YraN family protein [Planctomycetaceae bacterium]
INQFRALGHHVITYSRRKIFGEPGTDATGEIDLFLEDGDIAILVEVKTRLKTDGILDHIERMEKYRKCMDMSGSGAQKHYIGAVASPSVEENVIKFAHKKGFYVIVQTGDLFEIVKPPEGFSPKTW